MSIALHLDGLAAYGAAAIRIVPTEGEPEDLVGQGGGLEAGFDRVGQGPLLAVLRDSRVRKVLLADGDLTIEAARNGDEGRLVVAWGGVTVVDETVEIPEVAAVPTGAVFRPDPATEVADVRAALHDPDLPLYAVADVGRRVRWYTGGLHGRGVGQVPLLGVVPAVAPEDLGSAAFRQAHRVRWAYVAGAMAGGIASAELVLAMARAGLLGFFGAGGLPVEAVEKALHTVSSNVDGAWGFNLLHNPAEPAVEERTVDLYLRFGVPRVSASAYMGLTPAIVRYRLDGISERPDGAIHCPRQVLAKVSRPEVAEPFLRPAPVAIVRELVERGVITEAQAKLAERMPVAEDITVEADSGGHTDRRPLVVLLPLMQRLRDRVAAEQSYAVRPRVGAAGGIGTPAAAWAVFAMGADYVLTGSINQATIEAGTSDLAKELLRAAAFSDVATGPAPDMFELGAHVQVLSRGTMYAQRAQRLYDLYRSCDGLDAIPADERAKIEKQLFKRPLDEVWEGTRAYWAERDPEQVARADREPRHKMALTFRWYLGMTSRWARSGDADRKRDFQIWSGPAMGAFNEWSEGTELSGTRSVVAVATAMMRGAAVHARLTTARTQRLPLPPSVDTVRVVE